MTLYLDTSALMKLLVIEPESSALRDYLGRHGGRRAASGLVRTELRRAAVRAGGMPLLPAADALLGGLALLRVDDGLLDTAGTLGPGVVRSLDAVHLASALRLAPLSAILTYDVPMADAARSLGLPVSAPGRTEPGG